MHKPPRRMHTSTGRLLFARRYPRGRRAIFGVFSIPEPTGQERTHRAALKTLILSPQRLRDRSFFTGCGPWRLPFAQNPVCRHPRLLKTPKNARPAPPQASGNRKTAHAPLRLQLRQSPNSQIKGAANRPRTIFIQINYCSYDSAEVTQARGQPSFPAHSAGRKNPRRT